MLERRLAEGSFDNSTRYIAAAQDSVRRASALTHRLLAFSRRQTLDPKTVDIDRLVAGMEELIRRTVGPSVSLEVVGGGGLWLTKVDASQLENALLNLCINAPDAMEPDGGRLTIETANKWLDQRAAVDRDLPPGQYVSLSVSRTVRACYEPCPVIVTMSQTFKLLLIGVVVVLAGCAASVKRHIGAELKLSLSPAASQRIILDIQGVEELTASQDWEQFRNEWRIGMAEAKSAAGLTLVTTQPGSASSREPSTLVTVKINDYRYITRGARVAAGLMTGNAYIDAEVIFAELPGATPAGRRKYATTSSAMQGVFAPMTSNQIRGICDEIIKDVAQR